MIFVVYCFQRLLQIDTISDVYVNITIKNCFKINV